MKYVYYVLWVMWFAIAIVDLLARDWRQFVVAAVAMMAANAMIRTYDLEEKYAAR
jgi:hypothetical protein